MSSEELTDRGWAWMIVLGVTIINLSILPVQQCFGLIFGDRFMNLGITATQASLIVHLNGTVCCSLGLISGPMMKRFSFRKVAFFGGFVIAMGICISAFAMSLPTIIIGFCIIIGIGQGIVFPATSLALNTYFKKKRNVAMGISVTLTALGPIVMPLLIVYLLEIYATTGALLIFAGIAANSLVGASLLRPFRASASNEAKAKNILKGLATDVDERLLSKEGIDEFERRRDVSSQQPQANDRPSRRESNAFRKFVANLDLALLRDVRYVFVVVGMGVSLVAETNFNVLIPFVLAELSGLTINEIATVMSIQAAFDIASRLCVPLLAHKVGWTSRNLYVASLIGSTVGRTILSACGDNYVTVIVVAVVVGVAKGVKAVFQALIIPDYVTLERLPAASGIQMVCNGVLSICLGPLIGLAHDLTDSYVSALHFTSAMSLTCVFLWLLMGLWTPFGARPEFPEVDEKVTSSSEDRQCEKLEAR